MAWEGLVPRAFVSDTASTPFRLFPSRTLGAVTSYTFDRGAQIREMKRWGHTSYVPTKRPLKLPLVACIAVPSVSITPSKAFPLNLRRKYLKLLVQVL